MNEKLRKMLEHHGVDIAVGSIEYWQNEVEMALLEMCDEDVAEERKGCAEDYLKIMRDAVAKERQACIDIVEVYRIPVGNSPQGELAADWTYAALHEIRDEIKQRSEKARIVFTPEPGAVALELREKLAKPEQEFYPDWDMLKPYHERITELEAMLAERDVTFIDEGKKKVTSRKEWVGLTSEDWENTPDTGKQGCERDAELFDWIEQTLKDKNEPSC